MPMTRRLDFREKYRPLSTMKTATKCGLQRLPFSLMISKQGTGRVCPWYLKVSPSQSDRERR